MLYQVLSAVEYILRQHFSIFDTIFNKLIIHPKCDFLFSYSSSRILCQSLKIFQGGAVLHPPWKLVISGQSKREVSEGDVGDEPADISHLLLNILHPPPSSFHHTQPVRCWRPVDSIRISPHRLCLESEVYINYIDPCLLHYFS